MLPGYTFIAGDIEAAVVAIQDVEVVARVDPEGVVIGVDGDSIGLKRLPRIIGIPEVVSQDIDAVLVDGVLPRRAEVERTWV